MRDMRIMMITIGMLLLCAVFPVVSGTTLIAENGSIPTVGGTDDIKITADTLPNGLSGFEITATLADPAKAEIVQVITPAWAGNPPPLSVITSVPTDSVGILIIDFYGNVNHSISNLDLVTLRIRGDSVGATSLNLAIETLQDKDGYAIAAGVQNGTITIGGTPPPPATGSLNVTSNPTGASVMIDGAAAGTTPLLAPNITTGIHTVRVEKSGYQPLENLVTVNTGTTTNVHAVLSQIPPSPVNGTLNVQSTPTGADVFLDGTYRGISPLSLLEIPAGVHTLRLEKSGYYPFENPVTIIAGGITNVTATLTATPPVVVNGTITIVSEPTGAMVFLDGAGRGATPLTLQEVPAGVHTLRLEKQGYIPWDNPVPVTAGQVTSVNAVLGPISPTNGSIHVMTDPEGGTVFLDGILRGVSPILIPDVSQGFHLLRIDKAGYEPWEEVVSVGAGEATVVNATLAALPPPPVSGSVNVQSNPSGANVYLNGELAGISPVFIPGISPGTHTIRIEKTGYGPWEGNITVTAGATTLVSATLFEIPLPPTGSIHVQSDPSGANVFLDGSMAGITPALLSGISPGLHALRVEKDGYLPWESSVTVAEGATTVVSMVLEPAPTPPTTGAISIESDPPGADAFLQGVLKGTTPLSIVNLTPGSYLLRLNLDGYEPWEETIEVVAGETAQVDAALSLIPTPTPTPPAGYGSLYVSSLPTRATVIIDGVERGTTDGLISSVPAGTRQVSLQKAGFKTYTTQVAIPVGKVAYLQRVSLEPGTQPTSIPTTVPTTPPLTTIPTTVPTTGPVPPDMSSGSIFVYSIPLGCSVSIDGQYRGMTPSVFRGILPGDHTVRITFPGYLDEVREVQVQRMRSTVVTAVLVPDVSNLVSLFG